MAAITTAAIGVGMAAYTIHNAEQQKKKASRALNSYERQELDNAFKEIEISTFGSDILREENARTSAGLVDAAQQGGTRSIIGAVPKVVAATNQINQEAAKLVDDQIINRSYAIAGDNARIEGITENRDQNNINALGSQIQAANQDKINGVMGLASSLAYAGRSMGSNNPNAQRPAVESVESPRPAGLQTNDSAYFPTASVPFSNTPYSMPTASPYDDPMFGYDFSNDNYNKRRF